jgi:hypothetical protein
MCQRLPILLLHLVQPVSYNDDEEQSVMSKKIWCDEGVGDGIDGLVNERNECKGSNKSACYCAIAFVSLLFNYIITWPMDRYISYGYHISVLYHL